MSPFSYWDKKETFLKHIGVNVPNLLILSHGLNCLLIRILSKGLVKIYFKYWFSFFIIIFFLSFVKLINVHRNLAEYK